MSEENNKTNNDLSREELNEQLDALREKQQELNAKKKPYSRWGRLLGFWGAISGLFIFGGTSCCYSPPPQDYPNEDENETVRATCYEIVLPDENDIPDTGFPPTELEPERESTTTDAEADSALEEVQQYYEKVKQESPVNNGNNADSNDELTE